MEKDKLGITRFFTGYVKNFHKIILTNLLFAVPLLLFSALFYYINTLVKMEIAFITLAPVIFVFPFFSGVTLITRNIVKEEEKIPVFKLFIKGFKENFGKFFVHGIILYLAIFFCYSSIALYFNNAQTNGIFYFPFGIAVIIAVAMLFIFYNIPVMTVTFDLSLKNIYKNSALMAFGEIKNNFFSTVGLFVLFLAGATLFLVAQGGAARLAVLIIYSVLIVPASASYIMNFYVYKDMELVISGGQGRADEIKKKIAEKENADNKAEEALDFSALDLDERKDGDEYLYFNGKMIKRRVLIEMKKKAEDENEQKEEA